MNEVRFMKNGKGTRSEKANSAIPKIDAQVKEVVDWMSRTGESVETLSKRLELPTDSLFAWLTGEAPIDQNAWSTLHQIMSLDRSRASGEAHHAGQIPHAMAEVAARSGPSFATTDSKAQLSRDGAENQRLTGATGRSPSRERPALVIKLERWLLENHISRYKLAKKLKISKTTVYQWFRYGWAPAPKHWVKLYRLTGMDEFLVSSQRSCAGQGNPGAATPATVLPAREAIPVLPNAPGPDDQSSRNIENRTRRQIERPMSGEDLAFGLERLLDWMERHSYGWPKLRRELGAPRSTVGDWRQKKSFPSPKYCQKLYALTGIAAFDITARGRIKSEPVEDVSWESACHS